VFLGHLIIIIRRRIYLTANGLLPGGSGTCYSETSG